jgi:hypothetical protein
MPEILTFKHISKLESNELFPGLAEATGGKFPTPTVGQVRLMHSI